MSALDHILPHTAPRHSPQPTVGDATRATARRRSRVWIVVGIVVLALIAATLWWRSHASSVVRYVTAPVALGEVTRAVTASGTVNPVTTVQVGSYVSGVVTEVLCDYNTQVKKGQLCAKLDPRPLQATVEQDQAQLQTAQAQLLKDQTNLGYAKATYERNVQLAKNGLISQADLDAAKNAADQAQSQVKLDQASVTQRQAALDSARINLGYVNIVSPVDGTVVSRNVNVGQTVAASFQTPTLFLIASDLTKMQVDTNVSESDIGNVKQGTPADFTVEAFPNRRFEGSVTEVRQAPQAVQNVVTYDVVVNAPNPDLALKPGMTAMVRIITDRRTNVVRVPDQALRYVPGGATRSARQGGANASGSRGAGAGANGRAAASAGQRQNSAANGQPGGAEGNHAAVWVLRDGAPQRVPVTIGLDDDAWAEVVSGDVHPGDPVIVSEQADGGSSPPSTSGRGSTPRFGRF